MMIRPSRTWRDGVAEEARELAAGTLEPGQACMAILFPEALLAATDAVLGDFEADVRALAEPSDQQVMAVVERVVLALNAVNESFDHAAYETDERERLCEYIDQVLAHSGIDVPALTARQGIDRYAITDEWRDW
ncbi:hypothetical protein [Kitasatospora paracochleata]|uniref:Uncharacterized protein n=1 Tax=Kitasatospora paracochleata TaxID=58354 RepID=A0ABT1J656_9ACTN|nr:hypothetical protein [Kitasatospora paracochleata]MCP2312920.1 hypothetical protein [Kitasatospora paracochleata]